jgi:hypothetical protein
MYKERFLDEFFAGRRSEKMPFVHNDQVEITSGAYAGHVGTVDLLDLSHAELRYLVGFEDGTDEIFASDALRRVNSDIGTSND